MTIFYLCYPLFVAFCTQKYSFTKTYDQKIFIHPSTHPSVLQTIIIHTTRRAYAATSDLVRWWAGVQSPARPSTPPGSLCPRRSRRTGTPGSRCCPSCAGERGVPGHRTCPWGSCVRWARQIPGGGRTGTSSVSGVCQQVFMFYL